MKQIKLTRTQSCKIKLTEREENVEGYFLHPVYQLKNDTVIFHPYGQLTTLALPKANVHLAVVTIMIELADEQSTPAHTLIHYVFPTFTVHTLMTNDK